MSYSFEPGVAPGAGESDAGAPASPPGSPPSDRRDTDERPAATLELPELDRSAMVRHDHPAPPGGDVESRLERARAEAHQGGFEEGRRTEELRVNTAIEAVKALITQLERADERRQEEALDRIAALATAIAGHLVEREVRTTPDVVSDLVRRAVAEFPVNAPLSVHLNPSDLALLSGGLSDDPGKQHLTSGQSVRWVADPAVRSGGCLVEGAERVVDARLSQALERICRALIDV